MVNLWLENIFSAKLLKQGIYRCAVYTQAEVMINLNSYNSF